MVSFPKLLPERTSSSYHRRLGERGTLGLPATPPDGPRDRRVLLCASLTPPPDRVLEYHPTPKPQRPGDVSGRLVRGHAPTIEGTREDHHREVREAESSPRREDDRDR